MIITCKSCNTKYSINKNALGKNGKKVKCSNCGYEWYQKLHITKKNLPTKSLEKKQIPRNDIKKEIDAAALIYVAVLFIRNITDISWDQIEEAAPAVLAMIAMPLTYSISHGIAVAFIAYAAIKICSGDVAKVNPAIWVISILSVISFAVA